MPWLTVRDVPSTQTSFRIKGWKTLRPHHYLSPLEEKFHYLLDWSQHVMDIREQYPLPLDATLEIADRLNIEHPPLNKKEKEPLTTDFMIDFRATGEIQLKARTMKPADHLSSDRTIEKFEIERTYYSENYSERDLDWGIVTENEIPLILVDNVRKIHKFKDLSEYPGIPKIMPQIEEAIFDLISQQKLILSHAALSVDEKLGLEGGSTLAVVKHLIANRQWIINMYEPIDTGKNLNILKRNIAAGNEEMLA